TQFLPSGVIWDKDISTVHDLDPAKISEYVTHSWFNYDGGDDQPLHPYDGETNPNYTGPKPPYEKLFPNGFSDEKYSWLKSPRYEDRPVEVGPLARMLVAYVSGHPEVKGAVDYALGKLGVGAGALFSTLGRAAARGLETLVLSQRIDTWLDELAHNMGSGDLEIADNSKWDPANWPKECTGHGLH
ncbi:MAG: nickel-dependent hydrogenase large subunit, partial [Actinomycetia bacterium]|nr:nickel-dependent hydrogenase large subunit [Actinomycetes bacterium]